LWKAAPLETPKDIWKRGLFRLLWCGLAGAAVALFIGRPVEYGPQAGLLVVLVLLVAAAGVLADAFRLSLRSKQHP